MTRINRIGGRPGNIRESDAGQKEKRTNKIRSDLRVYALIHNLSSDCHLLICLNNAIAALGYYHPEERQHKWSVIFGSAADNTRSQ